LQSRIVRRANLIRPTILPPADSIKEADYPRSAVPAKSRAIQTRKPPTSVAHI
jgi:hypothetical protein